MIGDTKDFTEKLKKAGADTASTADETEARAARLTKGVGAGLTAVGGLATVAGASLEHLGHGLEVAHGGLEVAIRNAGQSAEDYNKRLDEMVKHQERFGHGAADTDTALATLVRSTGNTGQALKDMDLATQLAAIHHTSLAEAANTVAKMHAGAFRPLKEFGINIKDSAAATKELEAAQKDVVKADTAEADAATALSEMHARLAGVKKLSVAQTQQLHHAEEKAAETADAAAKAHGRLETATKNSTGAMDFNKAAALVMAKAHGTAEQQANTFGGRIDAVKTKVTDYAATIGTKVGPAMVTLGPVMAGVGGIMQSNLLPKIGSLIGSMAGAAGAAVSWAASTVSAGASAAASFVADIATMIGEAAVWAASMIAAGVSAAASWAVSMAGMIASAVAAGAAIIIPFLPIIVTVGAIGIAAYELYKHWDQVWGFIKDIASDAYHFIADHIGLIVSVALGPLALAAYELYKHWDTVFGAVKTVIHGVGEAVGAVIGGIRTDFDNVVGFVTGLPGRIATAAAGMWDGIKTAFKSAINWIIDAWNGLKFTLPAVDTHIPGVGKIGGFTLGTPTIPHLADGAIVSARPGGVLALLGEGGRDEAVTPLPRGGIGGMGGNVYNINVIMGNGPVFGADKRRVAQDLVYEIRTELIRIGDRQRLGLPA